MISYSSRGIRSVLFLPCVPRNIRFCFPVNIFTGGQSRPTFAYTTPRIRRESEPSSHFGYFSCFYGPKTKKINFENGPDELKEFSRIVMCGNGTSHERNYSYWDGRILYYFQKSLSKTNDTKIYLT